MLRTLFYIGFFHHVFAAMVDTDPDSCSKDEFGYILKSISPPKWPKICPVCNGNTQSPINIKTTQTMDTFWKPKPLTVTNADLPVTGEFRNDGHTLKFSPFVTNEDITLCGGPLGNETYHFGQFHLHWGSEGSKGSEHTIDGKQHAAEIHFVWYNQKYGSLSNAVSQGAAQGDSGALTVIGIFLDINDNNEQDTEWFSDIEEAAREIANVEDPDEQKDAFKTSTLTLGDLEKVLPDYKGFYHYKGSLTTPDCHEIVNWIVMKNVQFVTSIQLEALRCLVFWTECIKAPMEDNFRSPADLPESSQENREVMEFTQPPYIVCTCEVGDTGAMFSLTPGFPYQATIA